jgi:F0F1-type ATP synthase alpha subunit
MQKGAFDAVPVDKVKEAQKKLIEFLETRKGELMDKLVKKRSFDEEIEKALKAALEEFQSFNKF